MPSPSFGQVFHRVSRWLEGQMSSASPTAGPVTPPGDGKRRRTEFEGSGGHGGGSQVEGGDDTVDLYGSQFNTVYERLGQHEGVVMQGLIIRYYLASHNMSYSHTNTKLFP